MFLARYEDFDHSLCDLFERGGPSRKAFDKVNIILGELSSQGVKHFSKRNYTNHGETRIKNCSKVDLGNGFRLIFQRRGDHCCMLYAGDHDKCDKWLDRNKGLSLIHDVENNTVETVFMSYNENTIISDPKPSNSPLIYKLSADYQKDLLQNLDEIAILRIATLSGIVSSSEIKGILGLVADEKKQKLVKDVLISLANDDVENAEKRIVLEKGVLKELDSLEPHELVQIRDGDSI